jgi:hypothetical protein
MRYTVLLAILSIAGTSYASTVLTQQLLINFDGSIVGDTYTLGAGEVDTTGTFAGSSSPTISGGFADLTGGTDGFQINATSLGTLTTQNWVAETLVSFDSFGGGQLTVMDVQGDTSFRINNAGTLLEANYWDGGTGGSVTAALPSTGTEVHLAYVWDAAATSLTAYVDGISIGTIDNNAFATPDTNNISFGYFGRSGFEGRGIDGQLNGVAFSTFTGTFDEVSDFQLVPEPSTYALLFGLCGLAYVMVRRRS